MESTAIFSADNLALSEGVRLPHESPKPEPVRPTPVLAHEAASPASARAAPDAGGTPDDALRIVHALTVAIGERRLLPGAKLAERYIVDLFQVSRSVARQALHQLADERLVKLTSAGGAEVTVPCAEEARQVFQLRRMVESATVLQLGQGMAPLHLAGLRKQLLRERDALQRAEVWQQHRVLGEFHLALARAAGNDLVVCLLTELVARSSVLMLLGCGREATEWATDAHAAIVAALDRQDGPAAAQLMQEHLLRLEHCVKLA